MNRIIKNTLAVALLSVMSIPAFAGISGGVGYANDYIFRGQSQTGGDASIMAHIDWSHDSGVYAGVWTGEVDFDSADRETDMYFGYAMDLGSVGIDVAYVDYAYSGNDALDGSEIWLTGTLGDMSITHVMGQDDWNDYTEFGYSVMGVDLSFGMFDNVGDNVKVSKSFDLPMGLEGSVAYVDFTADSDSGMMDEDAVVFAISKSF
jgi:uncharacterized protein (TIGR02001 family)